MKTDKILPYSQLFYYLLTAAWPFVHLESFFAVTGPKTDIWLVKTVSLLLFPYILLILYIIYVRYSPLITLTVILGCLGLAGIDLYYYLKGIIRWVYLIDFILELIFVIHWIFYIKMNTKNNFQLSYLCDKLIITGQLLISLTTAFEQMRFYPQWNVI